MRYSPCRDMLGKADDIRLTAMIRFHDLRHSCASLLLANKIPMKMIQDWLGHSDMGTTSNIYSHLDANSKLDSAKVIGVALASGT